MKKYTEGIFYGFSKTAKLSISDLFLSRRQFAGSTAWTIGFLPLILIFIGAISPVRSQNVPQTGNFTQNPQYGNYMANSAAFRQEIARVEINVVRPGKAQMPITEVPRLQKGDVLKVRMLEEPINGVKPDQSNYEWTFLIAFLNPARNTDRESSLSEEIRFRKTGWYKEYSFNVPYDSQPIFFLYPKPEYRAKILSLISKNQDEIRKIGEKTIEISGAYAKIGSFLNELQSVVNRSQYYRTYGAYGSYYGGYGSTNQNFFMEQAVERLARSFNINLPNCWQGNGYNNYNNGVYNNYGGYNNYGMVNDFAGRVQCVAKSVRIEDFDLSVSRMLQQGGILAAAQLSQKYPQLAFWINIAAVAVDFILKITQKTPLKLVPTIITTAEFRAPNSNAPGGNQPGNMYSAQKNQNEKPNGVKISLLAESSPNDNGFVTAYPLVVHKWQPDSDPETISLPAPIPAEACLREGQNLLRNTDLTNDWLSDTFTKEFHLLVVSAYSFRREFPLTKNVGLGGWELNLTKEDLSALTQTRAPLEAVMAGKRGFNEVRSAKFGLPVAASSGWSIEPQPVADGASTRTVLVKNRAGCYCLQAVVYKSPTGEQITFEAGAKSNALKISDDGTQISFELGAAQNGAAQAELRLYGGETVALKLNLYPPPPVISDLKIARGDRHLAISGSELKQIKAVRVNGRRAIPLNVVAAASRQKSYADLMREKSLAAAEMVFVFEDPAARHDSGNASLELELEDNRLQSVPKTFSASRSRPAIVAGQIGEISIMPEEASANGNSVRNSSAVDSAKTNILPLNTAKISFPVQNALTDYDFKAENITIETRVENFPETPAPLAVFEIWDWKNLRIGIDLTADSRRNLAGKRLQFRLRDRERGDSDWYTIEQTLVRMPHIASVQCAKRANQYCEMKGTGFDLISRISVDGGKTWVSYESGEIKSAGEKQEVLRIPFYSSKKMLQIKLRDFPNGAGLGFSDYVFANPAGKRK